MPEFERRILGRILFGLSAILVFTATGFQIAKPYQEKSARALSFYFICIALVALALRIPYFVLRANTLGKPWYQEFPLPILYYTIMIGLYVAMLGTKIYWDKKEKEDKSKNMHTL